VYYLLYLWFGPECGVWHVSERHIPSSKNQVWQCRIRQNSAERTNVFEPDAISCRGKLFIFHTDRLGIIISAVRAISNGAWSAADSALRSAVRFSSSCCRPKGARPATLPKQPIFSSYSMFIINSSALWDAHTTSFSPGHYSTWLSLTSLLPSFCKKKLKVCLGCPTALFLRPIWLVLYAGCLCSGGAGTVKYHSQLSISFIHCAQHRE
jgi:hypothetical protein